MKSLHIPIAFFIVAAIWSTTPLAIQWSSDQTPITSAALRMLLGVLFCSLSMLASKIKLDIGRQAILLFLVGGGSIFFSMSLVYWSAQSIPSGWIAVLFGLSPLFTGLFSIFIDTNSRLTTVRICGIVIGLLGLFLVFKAGLSVDPETVFGVMLVIIAVLISASSSVLIQHLSKKTVLSGMHLTTGSLLVATPLLAFAAVIFEPIHQISYSTRAIAAIFYLGLIGTGIGFSLYYFLLKHCHANDVAMITLVTPISALLLGNWFNNETIMPSVWLGAGCVCVGLLLYKHKPKIGWRKL